MSSKPALKWLFVLSIVLPIVHLLLAGVEAVLSAMGDTMGAVVISYVALAAACLWVFALVGLVILVAFDNLAAGDS